MKHPTAERGFTLVELLAALAILAFGIQALITLKRTLHARQARQLAELSAITHEGNALALLRRINPHDEPSGTRVIAKNVTLSWQATATPQSAKQLSWAGRETPLTLTIYAIDYQVKQNGSVIVRANIELLGRQK